MTMISKQKAVANGATYTSHRLDRVCVTTTDATLLVSSLLDSTGTIGWQETVTCPLTIFSSGSPLADAAAWLVGSGNYLDGGTVLSEIAAPLETARALKRQEINDKRTSLENAGCLTPSGVVDSNEVSRNRITAGVTTALLAKLSTPPHAFSVLWGLKDNSTVTLDADGMIALGLSVAARSAALFDEAKALKDQLDAATTIEQVAAMATCLIQLRRT